MGFSSQCTIGYLRKGLFCSFRFREIVPLKEDVRTAQVRGESGDAGLVQLFDRLQPPAAHRQCIHQLPHLLLRLCSVQGKNISPKKFQNAEFDILLRFHSYIKSKAFQIARSI